MVNPKKSIPIINVQNQIDDETLKRINKRAEVFSKYVKLVSGSEYRGEKILTKENTVVFTLVLKHFDDLKKNGLLETSQDPAKLFTEYAINGNIITKKHEELIKDYQKYINAYLKENDGSIKITTSKQEKKFVTDVLKNLGWKAGKTINKTVLDERKDKTHRKYEIEVNEKGLGSIIFYEKNEKGEYEKMKMVQFDINEGRFSTDLYQILVDGKMGVETFRAFLYQIKKIQKEEVQEQEIKLAGSVSAYYANISKYPSPVDKVLENQLNPAYNIMASINYTDEIKIRRGGSTEITNSSNLMQKYYYETGKLDKKIISIVVDPFVRKYKSSKRNESRGFFSLDNVDLKSEKFKINIDEIEKDFEDMIKRVNENIPSQYRKYHLDLIQTSKEYLKERITQISNNSKNGQEFLDNLNKDDAYSIYLGLLLNYSNLPGQINIFETLETPYNKKMLDNESDKKRFESFRIYNSNMNMVSLTDMRDSIFEKNKELYSKYTSLIVDNFMSVLKNPYSIKTFNIKTEQTKTEIKKYKPNNEENIEPTKIKVVPTKSPSDKEAEDFIKLMKKNPALAKAYQEYYNERMKEEGKKYRLKVDCKCGDKTIATSKELPFDEFWALYNKQNTYERKILPKIKEKIQEDPVEMKKYNAYVQKMDKEIGGKPVEDKWTYLTSYINREDPTKKEEKEKNKMFRN